MRLPQPSLHHLHQSSLTLATRVSGLPQPHQLVASGPPWRLVLIRSRCSSIMSLMEGTTPKRLCSEADVDITQDFWDPSPPRDDDEEV
ncbi:unnamed protein product [Linum trigynum]|uniref:Uncharacterized protein n=1 Tax=Linum trigynum TaxID=586398 RepID=A0AAV2D9L2_9ROSI